jgi:hypothetical protein
MGLDGAEIIKQVALYRARPLSNDEVRACIRRVIAHQMALDPSAVTPDALLVQDLGIDA